MFCCCPRLRGLFASEPRLPQYQPLPVDAPAPSAAARELFAELQRGDAESREAVRLRVGENMNMWSSLLRLALADGNTAARDLGAVRWLLNDSGVHVLYWSFAIWREAARSNDVELVDLFLEAFAAKADNQGIDGHYVVTRTGFCLQGAAEGGHMDLVKHIHAKCLRDFGLMTVLTPKHPHPSIAEECAKWFDERHQVELFRNQPRS